MLTDQQIEAELQAAGIDMEPGYRRLREMLDAHRPLESQSRCEIRCGQYPRIGAENGHFVVHADADSAIVEDDLGPLDKARAQYWLNVMREKQRIAREGAASAEVSTDAIPQGSLHDWCGR